MTPAEKMAQELETVIATPAAKKDLEQSAALIRRLAAALVDAHAEISEQSRAQFVAEFRSRHATALRDVKEQA